MRGAAVDCRIRARREGEDEAFDEIFERVARDVEHITRRMERAEPGSFLEDYYRSVKDSEPASSEGQHASSERKLSWPRRPRLHAAAKQHRALTRRERHRQARSNPTWCLAVRFSLNLRCLSAAIAHPDDARDSDEDVRSRGREPRPLTD